MEKNFRKWGCVPIRTVNGLVSSVLGGPRNVTKTARSARPACPDRLQMARERKRCNDGPMNTHPIHRPVPLRNANGGAASIVIILVLIVGVAAGGGYWAYTTYVKQDPPRVKLTSLKVKAELVQFVHDRVSRALHHNMLALDDIVVMMDKELKRLQRIGKKFPEQNGIIDPQVKELSIARQRLAHVLAETAAEVEKIYVTWLVDRSVGTSQIKSQKGTLTRALADAIRGEKVLISRIRSNPSAAS